MNQFGINRSLLFRPYRTLNDLKSDNDLDVNMYCLTVDNGKLYKVVNNTRRVMGDLLTTIQDDTLDTSSGVIKYNNVNVYDHVIFDKFDEFESTHITKLNNSNIGLVIGKCLVFGEMCHIVLHLEGVSNGQGFRMVAIRVINERNGEELMRDFIPEIHPLSIKIGDILSMEYNNKGFRIYKNTEDFRDIIIERIIDTISNSSPIEEFIPKVGLVIDETSEIGNVARFNIGNERIADEVLPNGKKLIGASMTIQNLTVDGVLTISKNGMVSRITFPASVNDPGFISHYENNNVALMDFSVSDDPNGSDKFRFGTGSSTDLSHVCATLDSAGNLITAGTISGTKTYHGVYNDYAELFLKHKSDVILPGDIVGLDMSSELEIYRKALHGDVVVGVCSDDYGVLIGGETPHDDSDLYEYNKDRFTPVGLAGRVRVNVKGACRRGQHIVLSEDTPGVGVAVDFVGERSSVGIVLEDNSSENIKRVKIKIA